MCHSVLATGKSHSGNQSSSSLSFTEANSGTVLPTAGNRIDVDFAKRYALMASSVFGLQESER
jgi:hypothetical protein